MNVEKMTDNINNALESVNYLARRAKINANYTVTPCLGGWTLRNNHNVVTSINDSVGIVALAQQNLLEKMVQVIENNDNIDNLLNRM